MTLVRIIGNAPSVSHYQWDGTPCVHVALNLAPLAIHGVPHDERYIWWVQDPRFMIVKGHLVNPSNFQGITLAAVETVPLPVQFGRVDVVRLLGRFGFSYNPAEGVYEGYNAAYGAIQYVLKYKPSAVEFFGVDLTYCLGKSRNYQRDIGWDLDLHVHARQLHNIHTAIARLSAIGVSTCFRTDSLVERFFPVSGPGEPLR